MRKTASMFLYFILASGVFLTGTAFAFDTGALGGSAGTADWSLGCGTGKRVTGIRVKYGGVIDKLKLRCTAISSTGTWSNTNHEWTSYTASDSPTPATNTADALCASNQFVAGFNVYRKQVTTGQTVVAKVAIFCRGANSQSVATGNAQEHSAGGSATGGSWNQNHLNCTTSSTTTMAFGAKGRRGWYVDNMRLRCVDPPPPPPIPQSAPVLVFPRWNATSTGEDYGATPSWTVRLQPVANATRYQICLRVSGSQTCYFNQTLEASSAFASGNTLQFGVTIPADPQSSISQWTARACNSASQCGPWASAESFTVVPNAPALTAPNNNQTITNTRTVTFTWQANNAANAGYQLIIYRTGQQSGYNAYNPTAALPVPHQTIQIPAGTTSYTYTLAPGLTAVRWGVYACANFTGKGRRCSLGLSGIRGLSVPPFFAFTLAPTFKHDRCKNCHAVAADNFVKDTATDTDNGLPSNHTNVNATTNCASCHTNSLLPTQGTINPGWHAAPTSMDFRNRTDAQLCSMAQNPGSVAGSVLNHLTQDKLILWAVGDGRRPQNSTPYPTAPPNNITTWQNLIQTWVNAGTPCN